MSERARGIVIAAPRSGSGKTSITLALANVLSSRGHKIAPAKTGPDYIDPGFLARAASHPAINLDPWAMTAARLRGAASSHCEQRDILLIEGVMGLFDASASGTGSTADLAAILDLPVILVVDCDRQAQSIGALISGFANWRNDVSIAGVILNRVASPRHEAMLRDAVAQTGIVCLGAIPRHEHLALPERHLGLVLAGEIEGFDAFLSRASDIARTHIDFAHLETLLAPVAPASLQSDLPPLGQHIAIARDAAFAFLYPHLLEGWKRAGATLSFFSPLADEAPAARADAIFLPGGYPELHGAAIANAKAFKSGLIAAKKRGALIYGECGGFMVLGETLIDKSGTQHRMTGLLPVTTAIDRPKRVLGYRALGHKSPLPWPGALLGHEFHYSSAHFESGIAPLFAAKDAQGQPLPPMGIQSGNVMGSYAHVISADERA